MLKSSELAANGLSPPGVGAGLGAPKIPTPPPPGTPNGDAGAIPVEPPNTLSVGVGAIAPKIDGCEPNKLLADGVGAVAPNMEEVLVGPGAVAETPPNGLGEGAVDPKIDVEELPAVVAPKIEVPLGAGADGSPPNMEAPLGAAVAATPPPNIDDPDGCCG